MSNYVNTGEGAECPKCSKPMQHREHKQLDSPKIKRQPYYYSEWDYCRPCKHVQLYEHFKVYNKNQRAENHKEYLIAKGEFEEQDNFLRHIV